MTTARSGLDLNLLVAMYGETDSWSGVSGSSAGATVACPARLALPQARTTGSAAERGNHLHAFARVCTVNPAARGMALLDVPEEYRHTAEGMNLEEALSGLAVVGCEPAYALDVSKKTVRFIGTNIERKYNETLVSAGQAPLGRYEVPLSIDVEAKYGDIPVELDYKSGQSIGDPAEHMQRKLCAAALMLFHDTPTAISRVAYIWEDGSIKHDGHEFSILDVDDICDEVRDAIDAMWYARLLLANGVMPTVNPDPDNQCKYCSAMTSCPYWTNFAKSMLGELEDIAAGPELTTLTPEKLGAVWEMAKKAEKILEPILKGLKTVAVENPFPVGEKYEVRPNARSRAYFDDSAARGLIVTLMGKTGSSDEEIASKLKTLYGKTDYTEVRKVKRQLPMLT